MDAPVAFVGERTGARVEIVVNFGLLTGREATLAEVDRLARSLMSEADEVEIVAERRHEYGYGREAVVHQVGVHADAADAPHAERMRALCQEWAADCAADRALAPLDL